MSLRDYDKYTPRERRERAEGKVTLADPSDIVDFEYDFEYSAIDGNGQRWRKVRGKDWEKVVVDAAAAELTRKGPEAPSDTREDEKDSCQDNSVDAGVSVKPYEFRISWSEF